MDITLQAADTLDFDPVRRDDERGTVVLNIATDDGTVVLEVGCYFGAAGMADELERAAKAARTLVTEWQDRPDEDDGYVTLDRGRYLVQLAGKRVGDVKGYPTQDTATYALAVAMADAGYFPNTWIEGEHGPSSRELDTLPYFADGGDAALPTFPGATFAEGDEVYADGLHASVVVDAGDEGVEVVLFGDDERRMIRDRALVVPVDAGE